MQPPEDVPIVLTRPYYLSDRDCGYCKGQKKDHFAIKEFNSQKISGLKEESNSITIGLQLEQVTARSYDQFINLGYRRSGSFLYKPDLLRSCCRMYTIRTNLKQLKLDKHHRKTINRFIRAISPKDIIPEKKGNNLKFDIRTLIEAEKKSTSFYTKFEESTITEEKYQLYKKYQVAVHGDEPSLVTKNSFKRFLCDTPFTDHEIHGTKAQWEFLNEKVSKWKEQDPKSSKRIGPTHECYYLEGKLIAVSFMDFLPSGVSSIYFIWDPDYAHLSLGSLSSLREILYCSDYDLGYYYLGYYIDDCPKVNYKLRCGGEILDLCRETYVPIDMVKDYMKDGRLFVIDTKEGYESNQIDFKLEVELENIGYPLSFKESRFSESKEGLVNIVSNLFANPELYKIADTAAKVLKEKYNIYGDNSDQTSILPNVLPGTVPLWQILQWFEDGDLDDGYPVNIFRMATAEMKECVLHDLPPNEKAIVVNCIRLFGVSIAQQLIILV